VKSHECQDININALREAIKEQTDSGQDNGYRVYIKIVVDGTRHVRTPVEITFPDGRIETVYALNYE